MTKNRLLDRIKKLMKLGAGNANAHEAQSALLMAQKLMAENGLTAEALDALDPAQNAIEQTGESMGKRTNFQSVRLASILAQNFPVETWIQTQYGGVKTIIFCGRKKDVEIVREIFKGAKAQASRLGGAYAKRRKAQGDPTTGLKKIWIDGFLMGLKSGFKTQVAKNPNWALVLHTPQDVLDLMKNLKFSRVHSQARGRYDAEAQAEGKRYGQQFARGTQPQNPEIEAR